MINGTDARQILMIDRGTDGAGRPCRTFTCGDREREHALARAQLELALRQGTDPASLSIRVGPRGKGQVREPR